MAASMMFYLGWSSSARDRDRLLTVASEATVLDNGSCIELLPWEAFGLPGPSESCSGLARKQIRLNARAKRPA